VGELQIEDALPIKEPGAPIDPKYIVDLPQIEIPLARMPDFSSGRAVPITVKTTGAYLVLVNGKTVGLGHSEFGLLHPRVVF
jgi:hypothetical protein